MEGWGERGPLSADTPSDRQLQRPVNHAERTAGNPLIAITAYCYRQIFIHVLIARRRSCELSGRHSARSVRGPEMYSAQ